MIFNKTGAPVGPERTAMELEMFSEKYGKNAVFCQHSAFLTLKIHLRYESLENKTVKV